MTKEDKANRALKLLEDFNRKERYHLLRDAVSGEAFRLTSKFRKRLNTALSNHFTDGQQAIQIPDRDDVFVAMDYHLDWIAAALILTEKGDDQKVGELKTPQSKKQTEPFRHRLSEQRENEDKRRTAVIMGNQEDTDLLIAFVDRETGLLCLILVEAKVESGWDGAQIRSKGRRLWDIFGNAGNAFDFVRPQLVLAGPGAQNQEPRFQQLEDCPAFFFQPATIKPGDTKVDQKCPSRLCRMNLVAHHALYQPSRVGKKDKEGKWYVKRSFTPETDPPSDGE